MDRSIEFPANRAQNLAEFKTETDAHAISKEIKTG